MTEKSSNFHAVKRGLIFRQISSIKSVANFDLVCMMVELETLLGNILWFVRLTNILCDLLFEESPLIHNDHHSDNDMLFDGTPIWKK